MLKCRIGGPALFGGVAVVGILPFGEAQDGLGFKETLRVEGLVNP